MKLNRMAEEVLKRGESDFVLFSDVYVVVRHWSREQSETAIKRATITLVGDLLRLGLVSMGYPRPVHDPLHVTEPFEPWEDTVEGLIAIIQTKWDELSRPPDIGDIGFLRLTPAGRALAATLPDSVIPDRSL